MANSLLLQRIRNLNKPLSPVNIDHETSLTNLDGIRCVAFDFYGTMFMSGVGDIGIDEEQQIENAQQFTESLKSSGFTILNSDAGKKGIGLFKQQIEATIASSKSQGIDYPEPDVRKIWMKVLETLIDHELIEGDLKDKSARYFGIEFEFRINNIWPVPNSKELLETLLQHDYTLGIISNSQFYTPLAFEAFLGKTPVDFGFNPKLLIWSYKAGRKKPSRQFYQLFVNAAEEEGFRPEEVLYVGNDIRKDVQPAKSLGMKTALYVGDKRSIRHDPTELQQPSYQPDLIIDKLPQILECLQL